MFLISSVPAVKQSYWTGTGSIDVVISQPQRDRDEIKGGKYINKLMAIIVHLFIVKVYGSIQPRDRSMGGPVFAQSSPEFVINLI